MKICPGCEQELDESRFHKDSRRPDGLFYICKECRKPQVRRDYQRNKVAVKQRAKTHRATSKQRARDFVFNYLSEHPCTDCDEDDIVVLEFDHVRGDKDSDISRMIYSGLGVDTIQKEIDKCEVVCANCHKRRTYGRLNSHRSRFASDATLVETTRGSSGLPIDSRV